MTVVATDGRTMAADGYDVENDTIVTTRAVKLIRTDEGSIVGVAGDAAICEIVFDWFRAGEPPDALPEFKSPGDDKAFNALALRPDGTVQWMDDNFKCLPIDSPAAVGSGKDYARAAMLRGATPQCAVEFACEHIITCGGEITVMRLEKP